MRGLAAKIVWGLVICGAGGLLFTGCLAYLVVSVDADGGVVSDGLGRELKPSPSVVRQIFGAERMYPGAGWFFADFVIFWGSVGSLVSLGKFAVYLGNGSKHQEKRRKKAELEASRLMGEIKERVEELSDDDKDED